jgi:membrane-associated phospholipid phosphatase
MIFLDYIGLYAPIILIVSSLPLLRNKLTYLYYFIFGIIFNNIINILLKSIIQQPRPYNDQKTIEIALHNGIRVGYDKFGMPSGHAQNCGFAFAFITLTLSNWLVSSFFFIMSFISMFQRYLYNNHTITQLVIGFFLGIIIGYLTYIYTNKFVTGKLQFKPDDNGPL